MKKIILLSLLAICSMAVRAQKFALIDMEYIFSKVPAYEQANRQINQVTKKWQTEIETLNKQAEALYKDYQKNASALSPEQKKKQQDAIMQKEKQAADLKRKYFGPEGELAKLRTAVVNPLQDRIYEVIKAVSEQRGYSLVIDRSNQSNGIIYGSPKVDISNEVLQLLGINN